MNRIYIYLSTVILTATVIVSVDFKVLANRDKKAPLALETDSPDYSLVFPNDRVIRLDINLDKKKWKTMTSDLGSNSNSSHRRPLPPPGKLMNAPNGMGRKSLPGGPPRAFFPEKASKGDHPLKNDRLPGMEEHPFPPPGGHSAKPIWSYCDITCNNQQWQKVGIRFKGNSSLRSTYQMGLEKFSFKLDFDRFEEEFPEIKDQRFYGFKQLNLKNNYSDASFMREKLASDLFASFGLVTPKTAFCQVFVDFGEGPQYFGMYTLVEEVDDTVIKTQFEGKTGNLYKPDGLGATFAKKSFNSAWMNKKNHKQSNDYSDVQQLHEVLNSSLRTQNHKLWKSQLSEIFNVPVFLKWLAANNIIQNWDSYGTTFHNYYLYHNPVSNKLEWIPWDHNETFQSGKMNGALSLSLSEVDDSWPLIRFIIDDADWKMEYEQYLADFSETIYTPAKIFPILDGYQNLIAPFVVGAQGEQEKYTFLQRDSDFFEAVESLRSHVNKRQTVVKNFIQSQNF